MKKSCVLVHSDKVLEGVIKELADQYDPINFSYLNLDSTLKLSINSKKPDVLILSSSILTKGIDLIYNKYCCDEQKNFSSILLIDKKKELNFYRSKYPKIKDFVMKPFKFFQLVTSIKTVIVKRQSLNDQFKKVGGYILNKAKRELIVENKEIIKLTERESIILEYLLQFKGKSVSKKELLKNAMGYELNTATHTLDTHIYNLRKKLKKSVHAKSILKTDKERGYYLV